MHMIESWLFLLLGLNYAMDLIHVSFHNSYVETLIPKVMVLEIGPLGGSYFMRIGPSQWDEYSYKKRP